MGCAGGADGWGRWEALACAEVSGCTNWHVNNHLCKVPDLAHMKPHVHVYTLCCLFVPRP